MIDLVFKRYQEALIPSIATLQTLDFVLNTVTDKKAKILEVGCGKGDLAVELKKAGYYVTAVDSSQEAIEAAKAKDVDARHCDILEFQSEESFDCVLFTSSLHHIHPLDNALKKAKSLLASKGRLLINDFSLELMDHPTATWFYEVGELVGLLTSENLPEADSELPPLERWMKRHKHEPSLHLGKELIKGVERNFETTYSSQVPYLYRYFRHDLEGKANGDLALKKLFDWETELIKRDMIRPIGLRIVAKKHFSYLK